MADKDGIEEDRPYCPQCGAIEWEERLNSEGVDDSITPAPAKMASTKWIRKCSVLTAKHLTSSFEILCPSEW